MRAYTRRFPIRFDPIPDPAAVVRLDGLRVTILTSRMMRIEYSVTGRFEDRPSQVFWYRKQPVPSYERRVEGNRLEIETEDLLLTHVRDGEPLSSDSLSILLKEQNVEWHYGQVDPQNLGGTARTLDMVDGSLRVEPGILSRAGWAVIDDTHSLVFDSNGWPVARAHGSGYADLYFFGYGLEYQDCVRDFFRVSGSVPLVPRWALGNWWSRYWAYSAEGLLELVDGFEQHQIPLSVCIVDMDWHITETGNESSGWTGYTWNRDLFPDPAGFLAELKKRGLKTALNLHPAEGVHPHEEQYPLVAERMGISPESGEPVAFRPADPAFVEAYLELLHHPLEAMGVDFWWVDWQQGVDTGLPGLDPLWWLNHLHYYDLGRDGTKRSFVFSRWGGLGNHRYPIGFSGDTIVSWRSLAFQPYFTATAANVGYGWWSHDIGGHMGGVEEPELYARWVQAGVLSPILRLHSTNNPFHERRPWAYDQETYRVARDAMQLRHALVPYLHTCSWRYHKEAVAPIRPMYHSHPSQELAYHCPGQYWFGSELIAAPFVWPIGRETGLARQVLWLPAGRWFAFDSGQLHLGDRLQAVYGGLRDIPIFAKAGGIVPLASGESRNDTGPPASLEIHFFPGAENSFGLYEGGEGDSSSYLPISQAWESDGWSVQVGPSLGDTDHLPPRREYALVFKGLGSEPAVQVTINDQAFPARPSYDRHRGILRIQGLHVRPADRVECVLRDGGSGLLAGPDHREGALRRILTSSRIDCWVKQALLKRSGDLLENPGRLINWQHALSNDVLRGLTEVSADSGVAVFRHPADDGERVVMWNNRGSQAVRYRLLGIDPDGSVVRFEGAAPRIGLLKPEAGCMQFGPLEDQQPWKVSQSHWELHVDYVDSGWQLLVSHGRPEWTWRVIGKHSH